jgi:hypothetical protein
MDALEACDSGPFYNSVIGYEGSVGVTNLLIREFGDASFNVNADSLQKNVYSMVHNGLEMNKALLKMSGGSSELSGISSNMASEGTHDISDQEQTIHTLQTQLQRLQQADQGKTSEDKIFRFGVIAVALIVLVVLLIFMKYASSTFRMAFAFFYCIVAGAGIYFVLFK